MTKARAKSSLPSPWTLVLFTLTLITSPLVALDNLKTADDSSTVTASLSAMIPFLVHVYWLLVPVAITTNDTALSSPSSRVKD